MRILPLSILGTMALDQASKLAVLRGLNLDQIQFYPVWPPFLQFQMAWNYGVNFGLFGTDSDLVRWGLIALALAISTWVWRWATREAGKPLLQLCAGLVIGGAIGNVIDRIAYGAVADFLNMSLPGIDNPFSFNIADVAIFVGAIGLVFLSGRDKTP